MNDALATLPSSFDVRGLPFSAVFTYAVYTLSYVVVKVGGGLEFVGRWLEVMGAWGGWGSDLWGVPEVEACGWELAAGGWGFVGLGVIGVSRPPQQTARGGGGLSTRDSTPGSGRLPAAAPPPSARPDPNAPPRQGYAEVDAPEPPPPSLPGLAPPPRPAARLSAGAACPFPAAPLPLTPAQIGGEARMVSLYAHESVLNCVAWGLHRAGALKTAVKVRARAPAWEGGGRPAAQAAAPLWGRG